MPVTPEDVRHVAQLARLHLEPDEQERMAAQLDRIVAYIDQLQQVDTTGIEPLAHALGKRTTPLRDDRARPSLDVSEALANAPDRYDPFFKVPQMIEGDADA